MIDEYASKEKEWMVQKVLKLYAATASQANAELIINHNIAGVLKLEYDKWSRNNYLKPILSSDIFFSAGTMLNRCPQITFGFFF